MPKPREDESEVVRSSTTTFNSPDANMIQLSDYFNKMRYWTVLEHEPLKVDDTTEVRCKACNVINAKMKEFYGGCSNL